VGLTVTVQIGRLRPSEQAGQDTGMPGFLLLPQALVPASVYRVLEAMVPSRPPAPGSILPILSLCTA
jgi:hypothetical protein